MERDIVADLVHAIQISAAAEAVYPLVATGARFANWWAADVTEQNGAVALGFFNRRTVYRLRAHAQEPLRRAEWLCKTGAERTASSRATLPGARCCCD
jgi:hypothetical protein